MDMLIIAHPITRLWSMFQRGALYRRLSLQSKELDEYQINQLRRLRDYIAQNLIEVKLFDKSRLQAKLYLFLKDLEDRYGSPFLGLIFSGAVGVIIGLILGVLAYLLGPYAVTRVREIERGRSH